MDKTLFTYLQCSSLRSIILETYVTHVIFIILLLKRNKENIEISYHALWLITLKKMNQLIFNLIRTIYKETLSTFHFSLRGNMHFG